MEGMTMEKRIKAAQAGINSRGRTSLLRHFKGERLTQREAILAKCCDCMGHHVDGRLDCRMPYCALYPWMPYRDEKPVHPRRKNAGEKP
jgi:hypothetical protein